jgi:hypothetical protein
VTQQLHSSQGRGSQRRAVFTRQLLIPGLLVLGLASASSAGTNDSANSAHAEREVVVPRQQENRRPEPVYAVNAGIDGDIFPVFANFASMQPALKRDFGMVTVTITNPTDSPIRDRVSVKVAGWSDTEIQIAELGAGQVRTFKFAPTFLQRFYKNHEIAGATAVVEVSDMGGKLLYQATTPVRLRSVDDMYWGNNFRYAPFIAGWVTPHEGEVEAVLKAAKEFAPQRRLPGYEPWKTSVEQQKATYIQAHAIYDALKKSGVSYVKSSLTFGGSNAVSQRVRMPKESIGNSSANCIDGAVMFASLFENLAMDPVVVLVPGHAYVGVRSAKGTQRYLFIDTALIGRADFQTAVHSAETGLAKYGPSQITRIPIDQARDAGIFPMP